jgi:hypothetical protein
LAHLRFGVALSGCALGLALAAHVLVWCLIHFTDVRTAKVTAAEEAAPALVVPAPSVTSLSGVRQGEATGELEAKVSGAAGVQAAADPNVVESATSKKLAAGHAVVQTVGLVSAVVLAVLMLQGVVIAGGASVAGVEQAVTASTWALIIALLCVPLGGIVPAAPYPGVFASYEIVAQNSAAFRANAPDAPGPIGFYAMNMVLPLLAMAGVAVCVLRFRTGVEQGIIVTSVSEAEERIEREIRSRRNLGAAASSRAMGALNQTLGQDEAPAGGGGSSQPVTPGVGTGDPMAGVPSVPGTAPQLPLGASVGMGPASAGAPPTTEPQVEVARPLMDPAFGERRPI